uniref:Phospholipase-like protein n=1 Tax=Tanacetum cinerariifolium TaxID=118510 RepID=A0A6L2KXE0_TANCI|nr:phospholipase-like protein [Tanacetum cinerariifolium]
MLREDFCLLTGFRFGKVNLDPDDEDHYEFRMRVFPKIENLKGEHLLELVNKDVKFAKLDDEDDVRICLLLALDFLFMGHELRHVVSKPIVNLLDDFYKWDAFPWGEYMWSFFHKRDYNVAVTRQKFHLEKLASNPKYEANYVLYGFVFPLKVTYSIPDLRSATKGSSKGKIFHTRVRTEVRHETDNLSKNAPDCGLDQQSMGGISQCMNVDEPYKNWNDVSDNFHANGLDHKSVEGKSFVVDSPQFKVKDNEEACHFDFCLSTQQVRELINDFFHTPFVQVQDDVNVNSVVKEEIVKDDVNVNSLVKEDIEKDDVHKFPGKAYLSPYIQPSSTEVKCRKRRREIKLEKDMTFQDVTRSSTAPKRTMTVPEEVNALFRDKNRMEIREPNVDCAMASPYLCDILSRFQYPLYYTDGVKYGVPWFANNVQKVKEKTRKGQNRIKTGQKREACRSQEKFKAVAVDKGSKTEENAKRMVENAYTDMTFQDVTRSSTAPKRTMTVPEEVNALFRDKNRMEMREPNADCAMASPYLCDMLSRFQYPLYYTDGVKYGVPWFANNVQKVYFPINKKDSHWVLGELHISSGLITIYDSLGCPPNGIETRLFWLDLREKLQFQIP